MKLACTAKQEANMIGRDYPILEFDHDRDAFIRPERLLTPIEGISERAVLCFFTDAIEKFLAEHPHEKITQLKGEGLIVPVHQVEYKGEKIVLVQAIVGAPWAAGHMEELTAYGCRKYMVCGGCGVLQKDIAVGQLIIPVAAIRDEGTSYHYAPPSREMAMSERVVQVIETELTKQNAPYIKGKTWTTDAFFRETPAKIKLRKEENCIAVDMEASAFMAIAAYNNVDFGQIFYAGDNLGGEEWDGRKWQSRTDIREAVLKLTMDVCLAL